jgi:hypothetical protein
LSVGFVLAVGSAISEDYGRAALAVAGTTVLVPAAAALGVAYAGRGRGRTGRAYLCSYAGALVLGGLGFVVGTVTGLGPSTSFYIAYVGAIPGSVIGSVVGYNIR